MGYLSDLYDNDPYDSYERIRNQENAAEWDSSANAWFLTDHSHCAFVQRREDIYRHPYEDLQGSGHIKGHRSLLLLKDEEHRRVHRYFAKYFAQESEEIGESIVRPIAHRLLDGIDTSGPVDFGTDFADPLPVHTIAVTLGLEISDTEQLAKCKELNDRLTRWSETFATDPAVVDDAWSAADELTEMLLPVVKRRAEEPRDDLISLLHRDGPSLLEGWTDDALIDQIKTLFPAGGHTTGNFLCNAMYLLLNHPDVHAQLRADPGLVPAFVEEALRIEGPIHVRVREAAADHEICPGFEIGAGQRVHPLLTAAGRDPAVYDRPEEIDLGRPALRRHLAFSVGPRVCVGNELARVMAKVALEVVFERLPDHTVLSPSQRPSLRGLLSRSYRPLVLDRG